jgi:hypothetical protein
MGTLLLHDIDHQKILIWFLWCWIVWVPQSSNVLDLIKWKNIVGKISLSNSALCLLVDDVSIKWIFSWDCTGLLVTCLFLHPQNLEVACGTLLHAMFWPMQP